MTRIKSIFFCIFGLALFVYGSAQANAGGTIDNSNPYPAPPSPEIKTTEFENKTWQVVAALYKEVNKTNNGNFVQSPLSLTSLMVMLNAGAEGETAAEIQTVFQFGTDSSFTTENHTEILKSLNQTADKDSGVELVTTSRMFASKSANIREDYNTTVRSLGGEIKTLNFTEPKSVVEKTNKWVKTQTRGKISKLVEEKDFMDETAAVLLNAVYFKAPWKTPFNSHLTKMEAFHVSETETVQVDMMHISGEFPFVNSTEYKGFAVYLPFKGDRMSMIIYLPWVGNKLSKLEENLEHFVPSDVRNVTTPTQISLSLPKFSISSTLNLNPVLTDLRVKTIFDKATANFSKITATPQFHISKVSQHVFIQVNEEGTKDAPVTDYNAPGVSMESRLKVNRPFIFQIYDEVTGSILLNGRVIVGTAPPAEKPGSGVEATERPHVTATAPPTVTQEPNSSISTTTNGQAKNDFMAPLLIFCIILLGGRKMW